MTEVENRIRMYLQERTDNMVNEVLSQAMLDPGHNIPEAVGAFDKNWVKKVIVAEINTKNGGHGDELAEHFRGKLIDALESLSDGRDYAIVNIGYERNTQGILCATYVLSAEKSLFAEWEEVADGKILYNIASFVAEQEEDYVLKSISLRGTEFKINVNI